MKNIKNIEMLCRCFIAGGISILFLGSEALAVENAGSWRSTYDLVMRWLNFGIIVFLIVKFARKPLMNFLRSPKEALEQQIAKLEEEKEKITGRVKEALKMLDSSTTRFASLKQRIIEQGENEKRKIIEEAHRQSNIMIAGAKQKINSRILQTQNRLRSELIDEAFVLATAKLPTEINDEDNRKFADQYLASIKTE